MIICLKKLKPFKNLCEIILKKIKGISHTEILIAVLCLNIFV